MKLGNFDLLEPISRTEPVSVYRAREHLGEGISRPAAVKILSNLRDVDERKAAAVRREVELLAELSACPQIVTVYGCGIDEDQGAWIGMELAGKSLDHFIGKRPADPDQVRVLLRDTLQALAVTHGADPPILHRDLRPRSILCSCFATWQIGDFGFARRGESEETLNPGSVKYAAPEMLDPGRGDESSQADLYSLGMIAYQFSLGRVLFQRQFPSVFDPDVEDPTATDEGPKWMYWHTSISMTAPPIHEILDGFPEELSELIAAMMAKPLADRLASAEEGLDRLGDVAGSAPRMDDIVEEEQTAKTWRDKLTAYGVGVAGVALLLIVVTLIVGLMSRPNVRLIGDGLYAGTNPLVVTGWIDHLPSGGSAQVVLRGGDKFPVTVVDGEFVAQIALPKLGETDARLIVYDDTSRSVAERIVRFKRIAPQSVQITVRTAPVVSAARVRVTRSGEQPINMRTDTEGVIRIDLPYGAFTLEISHPRFRLFRANIETGAELTKRLKAKLTSLTPEELARKRQDLLDEMEEAINGDPDQLVSKLDRIREQLELLEPGEGEGGFDPNGAARRKRLQEIQQLAILAAQGDPEAIRRLRNIKQELTELQPSPSAEQAIMAAAARGRGGSARLDEAAGLTLAELRMVVEQNVPSGALKVIAMPRLDRVRISGPVFNSTEFKRLAARLSPAALRIQLELHVDPGAVCDRLRRDLHERSVRHADVIPFLTEDEQIMYVLFERTKDFSVDDVATVAREYVLDTDLIYVQANVAAEDPAVDPPID